jgi:tripartite-type tricarboxylate transporter receptor subunit TctC
MNVSALFRIVGLLTAAVLFTSAQAQEDPAKGYPNKLIRLVVGFAAGGANDLVARVFGPKLAEGLGQPVIVENRTGAAGMISVENVTKAKPDGYTLLFAASSMFTSNPVMFKKVPYTLSDVVPISTVVTFPFFVMVSSSLPIQSIKELVEQLKAKPGGANASGAAGIHQLGFELFKSQTGTRGEYIPYKSTTQSINAVMAGEVLMTVADAGAASGALRSGRVRALAVTSPKRLASYPAVPTVAELGLPDLEMGSWMGLVAPAGTPMPIVRMLQEEVNRIVKMPDFRERMSMLQVDPEGNTSEQFTAMISSDLARWRVVAKASNIEPTD